MQEVEYVFFLSSEMEDRLRVLAYKERGKILEFVVQYEAFIQGRWCPIVRYDTAHGLAHKDILHPDGKVEKQPLYFDSYNLAFAYATIDLKRFWRISRKISRGAKVMTKEEMIKKNLDLHAEFMKYTFENPEILDRIPKGARLVILPEDDPELYEENLKIVKDSQKKDILVVVVTMKTPKPIVPKIEIISSSN